MVRTFSTEIAAGTFGCGDQKFFRKGMQLTPVGREAGALRPGAAGQGDKEKSFALSAPAAWQGALCNSQLSFPREPTARLAVCRARVSTRAESEVEREGLELSAEAFALTH